MPHTSRKKKPPHKKRVEITDEDGWTRVTSSHRPQSKELEEPQLGLDQQGRKPYCLTTSDGHNVASYSLTPQDPPEGLTHQKLLDQYKSIEVKWRQSSSWSAIKATLLTQVLGHRPFFQSYVCFGLGTFSGLSQGWIDRRNVSLYQLAAFNAVRDLIAQCSRYSPPAFAQEPQFNTYDQILLRTLGIQKVDHPTGFSLVTSQSFVFCPGAEQFVLVRSLYPDPLLLLAGKLEAYLGADGRSHSMTTAIGANMDAKNAENRLICNADNEDHGEESKAGQIKIVEEVIYNSSMIDHFRRDKRSARLPDLNAPDYPFHEMYLYWRSSITAEQNADTV